MSNWRQMGPFVHSRVLRLVEHYGIPLREAKQFAKHDDWKERAGLWQRAHDPVKTTRVYSNAKPKRMGSGKENSSKMSKEKFMISKLVEHGVPLQTLMRLIWFGEEE